MTYLMKYNITNFLTDRLKTVISEIKDKEVKVFKGKKLLLISKRNDEK